MHHNRGLPAGLRQPPFVLLCVSILLGALAPNMFLVVPPYLRNLGLDEARIGSMAGAFSLASMLCLSPWARAVERFGGRGPMAVGMLFCATGSLAFEWSKSLAELLLARAVQGVGWSAVLVCYSFIATDLMPAERMAQALGVSGAFPLIAMALGPAIGELIAAHSSFQWLFRVAALVAVLGAGLALRLPRGSRLHRSQESSGFRAWRPGIRRVLSAMFLVATGFGATVAFLADHAALRGIRSVSPFFTAYVVATVIARATCGSLSDRVGRHPVLVPSLAGQAAALVGLAFLSRGWQLWATGLLFGFTHGLYYPALIVSIVERGPSELRARAVASGYFAFALGMSMSSLGNGVIARHMGYRAAFLLVAILVLISSAMIAAEWRGQRDGIKEAGSA